MKFVEKIRIKRTMSCIADPTSLPSLSLRSLSIG
ncbi:hypothetical protein AIOGIFDO_00133 [Candidatus Methanoperedenaceae archaeon GB37]|nr:hypothetical protein AIOGIFDO_00133 [Candidatus Methanoperedenaceae archaeon GB37]